MVMIYGDLGSEGRELFCVDELPSSIVKHWLSGVPEDTKRSWK
jgi:hypothetical protein